MTIKSDYSMLELQERFDRASLWIAVGMALALLSLALGVFAERFV
jgi:hypothetical protein